LGATAEQYHSDRFDYYGERRNAAGKLLGERPANR
jgi:hypothetical protein